MIDIGPNLTSVLFALGHFLKLAIEGVVIVAIVGFVLIALGC